VDGVVQGKIYTKFCKIKPNNEFGDFQQHFDPEPVAREWLAGDRATLDDGERQCRECIEHWMVWVQAQICDKPPAIRFDFFIGRTSTKGKAVIWTLEICELGFSMLGEPDLPKKVFDAMLHHCLDKALPEPLKGSDASKDKVAAQASPKEADAAPAAVAAAPVKGPASSGGKGKGKVQDSPEVLYVNVPVGNNEQKACTGTYERKEMVANGLPVWRIKPGQGKAPAARWLYNSQVDGFWYIGDDDEYNQDFNQCNEGYVRCEGSQMPHLLEAPWEHFDDGRSDWIARHEILVATEAEVLDAPPPGAGTQGAGKPTSQRRGGKGKRR
jgi:hypothetical protein